MNPKTLTRLTAILTLTAALATIASTSGCIAVAAGAGAGAAVAYVRGDLDATLDAGFDRAGKATGRAIEVMKFAKVSEKTDAMQSIWVARNAADKKIEIRLERVSETVTKIKIRVGVFGDEALSLAVLDKVKASL